MIYYLLITAFTVSVDSLLCGFSLSFGRKNKIPVVLGITLTVFAMCLIANYAAMILSSVLNEKTACIGGIVLIGTGVFGLIKKEKESSNADKSLTAKIFLSGFAVGLDGAFANLSLSLMGINAFYVPVIIALMHGIMVFIGILLSEFPFLKKAEKLSFLPSVILIILGLYKLSGLIF